MENQDLLPCPFCGGEAKKVPRFSMGYAGDGIKCSKCNVEIPKYITDNEAVELWNSRKDNDSLAFSCKQLVKAVDFFDKVKASSEEEKVAVGTDHWDWLVSAAKDVVKAFGKNKSNKTFPVADEKAQRIINIFGKNGICIELGEQYSVKGQIAQLINGSAELLEKFNEEK